jgi:peptidoglycan hydrolase-like protein with peptidoglycan-binding domain
LTDSPELLAAREVLKGLQTDLRDAGFYTGQIDGKWGPLSAGAWREALQAAKLRVEAELPASPPPIPNGRTLAWGKLEGLPAFKGRPGAAQAFRERIFWIADDLQMPKGTGASDLMSCIAWESAETFSADIKNAAGSGATGLIQFMPTTAVGLKTTTTKLAAMTPEDQLNYVYKYFRPWKGKLKNLGDLYMAILWPLGVGKPDSFVLWEKGSRPTTYRQNAGLDVNKDSRITRGEAVSKVLQKVARGHQADKLWSEAAS